MPFQARP